MSTVTLRCQAGHDWERERQRGRKPLWCPKHRPVAEAKPPAPSPADGPSSASRRLLARAEEALTRLKPQEAGTPISYIANQARKGHRDDKDIAILDDALTTWIRQHCYRKEADDFHA